jgi:hypothetical protein
VIEDRTLQVNEFDPRTVGTLTPLVDMIQHDAKGGNVRWEVEVPDNNVDTPPTVGHPSDLLLVATKPIRAGQELSRAFSRCYSVSYTLYRYGFLAVRDREMDRREDLLYCGVDSALLGEEPAGGVIGGKTQRLPMDAAMKQLRSE